MYVYGKFFGGSRCNLWHCNNTFGHNVKLQILAPFLGLDAKLYKMAGIKLRINICFSKTLNTLFLSSVLFYFYFFPLNWLYVRIYQQMISTSNFVGMKFSCVFMLQTGPPTIFSTKSKIADPCPLGVLGSGVRGQMSAGWDDSLFLVQTRLLFQAT